jgi:hypothetical protein
MAKGLRTAPSGVAAGREHVSHSLGRAQRVGELAPRVDADAEREVRASDSQGAGPRSSDQSAANAADIAVGVLEGAGGCVGNPPVPPAGGGALVSTEPSLAPHLTPSLVENF